MIGSTTLSHAVVLDLISSVNFFASLAIKFSIHTVMKVVVETTSDLKDAAPTTVTLVSLAHREKCSTFDFII